MINTGSAASILYQQGVHYANGEFIQIHPTAIPGDDKLRLMSESARGEGGRVWTYKDGKPWYFLEEKYPAYGNLVPRDIATREIFNVCVEQKLGINGENMVYLDLSHKDPKELDVKLGGIIEIYEKFMGDDPRKIPMKIFPAVHYSMGGMWVDFNQMTNIPGLFACGEAEYQYHGANRLGANSLLSCIYGGTVAGPNAVEYISGLAQSAEDLSSQVFDREQQTQQEQYDDILKIDGTENPYVLHQELGEWMTNKVTVDRNNDNLEKADNKTFDLMERYKKIGITDGSSYGTQATTSTRHLWNMLELARVITIGALMGNESRGAHYKPDFPERDDENFLKTTKAAWTPEGPQISYEDVDVSLIAPRKRDYTSDKKKEEGGNRSWQLHRLKTKRSN